jgi:hypothetical protein
MHDPSQRAKHNPATKNCNNNTKASKQGASRQDFRTDFQCLHGHQTLNHPCFQMNESLSNRKSAVSSMNESLSPFWGIQYSTSANICNTFFGLFAILFSSNLVI